MTDAVLPAVAVDPVAAARRKRVVTLVVHALLIGASIVMLYPLSRLQPGENQVLFDGSPAELATCPDLRVRQFIEGSAGDRLEELARQSDQGGS